ncbi:hypothetical protein QBC46DRAFT_394160 [Diplogelasinospora grovesii]|uniref:D-isomer specific 2-hydroxyacid dehydrogenase NAD-binding domain-containing protein n=1 Tax=Diplogelasinospora grovesii TaxID=303347 RepID=A0AAN6N129_9PEZI|nr:hypothetical protein QBC46DRAFT_394160 [Diplogelasinospora grovesii]
MMGHHFLTYAQQQKDGIWKPLIRELQIHDSPGMRMGILGYGAIGRQCARLGQALGMEVYAYTRSEKPTPESRKDDSYCVPGTGDPDGLIPTMWFHGASKEAVNEFLGHDLDILVKTFVSNVARGGHIDTDALIDALKDGKIRGAALDVVDPEPLPDNHPIMSAPNLFITPHVSWQTPHLFERLQAILEENLERLSKGEKMINVMDREHHY